MTSRRASGRLVVAVSEQLLERREKLSRAVREREGRKRLRSHPTDCAVAVLYGRRCLARNPELGLAAMPSLIGWGRGAAVLIAKRSQETCADEVDFANPQIPALR